MSVVAIRLEETDQGPLWTIASDTQITTGAERDNIEHVKLFAIDEHFVVGTAGSAEEAAVVKMIANQLRPARADVDAVIDWMQAVNEALGGTIGEKSGNLYLIIFEGKAFFVQGFFVYEIAEYEAIGSGAVYARTGMFLGATAEEAVGIATKFDIYCSAPTQSFVMEASGTWLKKIA